MDDGGGMWVNSLIVVDVVGDAVSGADVNEELGPCTAWTIGSVNCPLAGTSEVDTDFDAG